MKLIKRISLTLAAILLAGSAYANTNVLMPSANNNYCANGLGDSGNCYISASTGLISAVPSDVPSMLRLGGLIQGQNSAKTLWVAGRYYGIPASVTPVALLTITATQYAYAIIVPNTVTVKALSVSVTTGQTGGAMHFGIYADNGSAYPGALVLDSGAQIATSGAGVVTASSLSTVLQPGLYWISSIFTASSTMPSVAGSTVAYTNGLAAETGWDTAAHSLATSGEAGGGITVAGTYGALPATFPSGAALNLGAGVPLVSIGL